ncbi:MAG: hypothetical protein ACLFVQ_11850 [Chitinispirillaceae bacterium]
MFFYIEFLWAILVALFITGILVAGIRKSRPAVRVVIALFFLLFLGVWAGGLWLTPIGPPIQGVYVVAFFVAGVVIALLMAAAAYPYFPLYQAEEKSSEPARAALGKPVGAFFWALIALLVLAIAAAYIWPAAAG